MRNAVIILTSLFVIFSFGQAVFSDSIVTVNGEPISGEIDMENLPSTILIETPYGLLEVDVTEIEAFHFGESVRVELFNSSVYTGQITNTLPNEIRIVQSVVTYSIKLSDIQSISFSEETETILNQNSDEPREVKTSLDDEFDPWQMKYFIPESIVASLGAAVGGFAGLLIGTAICANTNNGLICISGSVISYVLGTTAGATSGVNVVASMFNIEGNKALSFWLSIGGAILFSALGIPGAGTIGVGIGATIGFNLGAVQIVSE